MCEQLFFGSADLESTLRAAVSEGAGQQAPGGDVSTAEEVREEEQRLGGGQDAPASRATQQKVKTVCPF